jgi:hypothetical protein
MDMPLRLNDDQLRKVTKARGHFPTDDAVVKLLWLAIINIEDKRARERAVASARRMQGYFLRCVSQLLRVIGLRAGICPGSSGGERS